MGQVTIYIDDDTEKKMAAAAKSMNVSKSKWITNLIKDEVANEWPQAVVELAGAWDEFPSLEEIRAGAGTDHQREPL
ncbi:MULTISPECIES: CopG family transcriptional regulator [Halomonadaceae]|jgi:predicted transcriptional regulator|uniref:CopG family transcriptional regulator n=1 Tax=Halomonadaceae TaxID=28256 RepID=UPI00110E88EF|nr:MULTISPECIES: CopG family transcriptional regulator [Halomonas]TMU27225.1 CopG family transcriptional regulator [Halomonas sp. ATBC28]CAD5273797.1 CopG family transcriptional regulator [Halomonas sp. 156]CAD5277665.1 CopG family transcriptional regulator [Halomonas sp. 113]CAD5279013.1 CopG family transcriptional regulator [Halomonas sp. 59]CAD5284905.1 CopG family transcriptional regulator [Halomonas sp. I3]